MDDFSKYPRTLGDCRSDKTEKASDWTVREMLIELLRRIDSGENIDAAVINYRTEHADGKTAARFLAAGGKTIYDLWAINARGTHLLLSADK